MADFPTSFESIFLRRLLRKNRRTLPYGSVLVALTLCAGGARAAPHFLVDANGTFTLYSDTGVLYSRGTCPGKEPSPFGISAAEYYDLMYVWEACQKQEAALAGPLFEGPGSGAGSKRLQFLARPWLKRQQSLPVPAAVTTQPASSNPTTPALDLSTAILPFLGNPLVVVSYVPTSTPSADATSAASVGLRRQSDCSLNEDFVFTGAVSPNAGILATLPSAEVYVHQLAGLTTTPDIFAEGCDPVFLGQPSTILALLQPTTDGGVIAAALSSELDVTLNDPVANRITTTTLLSSAGNPSLSAFASAPLTASGNTDIVATFATDPVTQQLATAVFLGNGDGTFKPGVYYDIPGDVTIDDVNGDGIPDIVVCGDFNSPGITTLIGKGDGTFTVGPVSATSMHPCYGVPGSILTGDFNGDGKKDLLVQNTVLIGKGDGTFAVGSTLPVNTAYFQQQLDNTAVGDVNGDGKPDVVVAQQGIIYVFYGKGDGTFTVGPRYAGLPGINQLSLTDLDGDGNLDVVLGISTAGIYAAGCCGDTQQPPLFQILMGRGDGTFVDSTVYNQGYYGGTGPTIATADFIGDGKPDVLVITPTNVGGQASTLTLLPGTGSGALGQPVAISVKLTPYMLLTTSINKSGRPDVVLAGTIFNSGGGVAVLLNQGNGTFAQEQDYALADSPVSLVAGDFNGDGITDLAVGVAPGVGNTGPSGVYVLLGQPNGTFGLPVLVDSSLNPTGLAAGDINGDGRSDLIVADQGFFDYAGSPSQINGAVHVYLGNANGSLTGVASPQTSATNYSVAALGDLNGDGKLDLILGGNIAGAPDTSTPSVYTLLGRGDGTFQPATASALVGNYGIGSTSIALADFNKDGHLDIAVGDPTAFTAVLLGNGDGTLSQTLMALGQTPGALAAIDLNGDGFPELLIGSTDVDITGDLTVFLNQNAWPTLDVVPTYGAGQVTLPTVVVGTAVYSGMVVTISGIDSGPAGTAPGSSGDTYNPATSELTVPAVSVGSKTYYNAVAKVDRLVSIGSVAGADTYDGTYLSISAVQVGSAVYNNVVITPGKIIGVGGGMPKAALDQYTPSSRQLLIPAITYNGSVYTNVIITVGTIVLVNGASP